eukprot:scaffold13283_cov82-Cyclotella_meneghiniana.AAC.1
MASGLAVWRRLIGHDGGHDVAEVDDSARGVGRRSSRGGRLSKTRGPEEVRAMTTEVMASGLAVVEGVVEGVAEADWTWRCCCNGDGSVGGGG